MIDVRNPATCEWLSSVPGAGAEEVDQDSGSPFGGYKQSGFGRDLGAHALEQYTNVKSVRVALA